MEMSGFTQEQLDVREAISKICANYPDACFHTFICNHKQLTVNRNIGWSMTNRASTRMIYTEI